MDLHPGLTKLDIECLQAGQRKMTTMLYEFDRVCRKYNLKYWSTGGTLIGAVRHKGWVPWDGDVDLCMIETDYEIFKQHAFEELPTTMWLQDSRSDPNWTEKFCKLRDLYSHYLTEPDSYHNGLQIDIFLYKEVVLDYKRMLKAHVNIYRGDYMYRDTGNFEYDMIFPVKDLPFESFQVYVPGNYTAFCELCYDKFPPELPPVEKRFPQEGRISPYSASPAILAKYQLLYAKMTHEWFRRSALRLKEGVPLHHGSGWSYLSNEQWASFLNHCVHKMPLTDRSRVLEAGCGVGAALQYLLRKNPALSLYGMDICEEAIVSCRRNLPMATVQQGDVRSLPMYADNHFDSILSICVLSYLSNLDELRTAVLELIRIAKPGATLNLCVFTEDAASLKSLRLLTPKSWWNSQQFPCSSVIIENIPMPDFTGRYSVFLTKGTSPVRSWDVFDTLIARTVANPADIFSIVERTHPYPSFRTKRIEAERISNGTIEGIYKQFQAMTGESDECVKALRRREFQTELDHTIPIQTNVRQLTANDILISDMYLTESEIAELLRNSGIVTYKKLYVFASGKHHGFAWDKLSKEYIFVNHTGDNVHSDILMPARYGIRGLYTDAHKFTQLENTLLSTNPTICRLFRKFRLSNPYGELTKEYTLFNEQINYNIPLLLFMCRNIANALEKERRTTVLFLTRDGCFLIKLFKMLYPQYNALPFHSSRIMNKKYNMDYIDYIRSIYNKDTCLLFDLCGSFESARPLFLEHLGHLPRVLLYQYTSVAPLFEGLTYIKKYNSDQIEALNADLVGTLCNFIGTNDIRMPLEYNRSFVKIYHDAIDSFCKYVLLENAVSTIVGAVCFDDSVLWNNYCDAHIYRKNFTITNYANVATLAKLAEQRGVNNVANLYAIKYEKIIDAVVNKCGVERPRLLQVGLHNETSDKISSLMMWQDYFHKCVDITAFVPDTTFLKTTGQYDTIQIYVGEQSSATDLSPLKVRSYHIIIDAGNHSSKQQQIAFKTMWESVEPGGFYVIENSQQQKEDEAQDTQTLFKRWAANIHHSTEYITSEEVSKLVKSVDAIDFLNSNHKERETTNDAFISIRKRKVDP